MTNVKRQSVSPSPNGSSVKPKHLSIGKPSKGNLLSSSTAVSQARSPPEAEKKRRKSKDAGRPTVPNKSGGKHASYASFDADNQKSVPQHSVEANGAAQCVLDASKLPPFVSPLSDGAYGSGAIYPSTSTASRDDQRHIDAVDGSEQYKKKSANKLRQKGAEKSTGFSPTARNAKRALQNGGVFEDKAKRKKTKSDSGLDSDYSSGIPNAHSPVVANGHSAGVHDAHAGGSALFSPPDSVRSLDTLQESPASAASSSSGASAISSNSRARRLNGCDDDSAAATTSSAGATTDQDRLRMLILLQQKIMTIKEKRVAQRVADIIATHNSYELTSECLEFDLCSLDSELIQRLLQLLDLQV